MARKRLSKKVRYVFRRFFKFYLNYWTIFLWVVRLGVLIFERSLEIAYGNQMFCGIFYLIFLD